MDMEEERNPFTLPSDEEVFKMRDEEKRRKKEYRETQSKLKVWEKTTRGKLPTGAERLRQLIGEEAAAKPRTRKAKVKGEGHLAKQPDALERRGERECMADFLAKKKEMFYTQLSLDVKREEIQKLQDKATQKEEALRRSEQKLEEDAIRFDTFLKENDKRAHDAVKEAEAATKKKNDKVQEIKRLNQQLQAVSSEMSKQREALDDCLKYREFLDGLTPEVHFQENKKLKAERQEERRQRRIAKRVEAEEAKRRDEYEHELAAAQAAAASPKRKGKKNKVAPESPKVKPPDPVDPADFDDEPLTSSDEECPMYFKQPRQLLDIFEELEEQTLFLIQNCQETERQVEELKQHFADTQTETDAKATSQRKQIRELNKAIDEEEAKKEKLEQRMASAGTDSAQAELLRKLNDTTARVYEQCGFGDGGGQTLTMLADLEARLEQLLDHVETLPPDYVAKAEKYKEKKRRERNRIEAQKVADAEREERNRKSVERSMQAPKKRTGRMVMHRSRPPRKKVDVEVDEVNDDDKYLT